MLSIISRDTYYSFILLFILANLQFIKFRFQIWRNTLAFFMGFAPYFPSKSFESDLHTTRSTLRAPRFQSAFS